MTTKPKGRKYRIRQSDDPARARKAQLAEGADMPFGDTEDGFGEMKFADAARPDGGGAKARGAGRKKAPEADKADADAGAAEGAAPADGRSRALEAIRAEGLSNRQLRMARRLALRHDLEPEDDYDAVRLLRAKGIDPFARSSMMELISPAAKGEKGAKGKQVAPGPEGKAAQTLPATTESGGETLPSTEMAPDEVRAREIIRIQRDIARRRRRKMVALFARLTFFVLLPTIAVWIYYAFIATPLYATRSEFLVQKADSGSGQMGGLFSGSGFANAQDSITVQSYLQSREAMLRLDSDVGFKAHFSGDNIDPLLRLPPDASNEEAYRLYKKMVKIGFDPTEGLVKMEVIAADPQTSVRFSQALITYAEEQVDNLTQRLRKDQMRGSRESYEEAERKMLAAQEKVLALQEKLGVVDPASETAALMGQITTFETQLQEKKLQLQQLLDNPRPNQARVDGVRGDIKRLEEVVATLRAQLTKSGAETTSLARVSAELKMAQVDLETRQAMVQQALKQLETARIEANRQVRYLSLGVSPTAPDEPTYPRVFENTLVAFFIFAGLYLMASLTASVLREQVSA